MTGEESLLALELQDRFDLDKERVFLNGTQALVRLCLMQSALDKRQGLHTAGYVSGYRGSPLGGLDQQFPRAGRELDAADVVFEPALNEDLAATAIWGAQQAQMRGEGRYDGVFCMWYGKGPGVDRSGDVFRHANLAGTSPHGGVMVLMGDDHTCESSTTAHQSEFAMMDAMIPVLNPANIHEIIQYGLHAWALSRYAGVWCGLKCVKDNIESTASVDAGLDQFSSTLPDFALPDGGLNIRVDDMPVEQEARLHRYKIQAAQAYARQNRLDKNLFPGEQPSVGIVSTGKSCMDTLQALEELGISAENAAEYGVALYKVAMPWPLEPEGIREFCSGLELLIVVEEKRSLIEAQIRSILYGSDSPPQIIGKQDETGATLFQSEGALNPVQISAAIAERLTRAPDQSRLSEHSSRLNDRLNLQRAVMTIERKPYFCAGCPHNSSTVIPPDARAYAGIGCHWMVQFMDRRTQGYTHMGGEGANWIGESRFSTRDHIIQNIGDGTFNHSGLMAIRAAIAANSNITFKLLYNDAVAMTGGQRNDGGLNVYDIVRQCIAAGARETVIVSDRPAELDRRQLPANISIDHREQLIPVQQRLAAVRGVTVLVYEQTCASEKRRRRKRGLMPAASELAYINEAVCEGCGDCGLQSNCVAIVPVETELGRKRQIDQSSCNQDLSCINGFCPSFVSLEGASLRKPLTDTSTGSLPAVAEPQSRVSLDHTYAIALTGIGGSGVVTIAAILGMAAHLEGRGCGIIDMAGLAQKGGAVVSHIRLAAKPEDISAIRIAPGGASLLLGCDLLVSTSEAVVRILDHEHCQAVVNTHQNMPGSFTREPDLTLPVDMMRQRLQTALSHGEVCFVDATDIAATVLGDSIAANLFLLGVAYQRGLIPLGIDAINKAVELNGVAVEFNRQALHWGRLWQHDAAFVEQQMQSLRSQQPAPARSMSLEQLIDHRAALLTQYQDARYAGQYRSLVEQIRVVDTDKNRTLTEAVARYAYKLRARKDEYEVARLYTDPAFEQQLKARFEGSYRINLHLAAPLLARRDRSDGEIRKRRFGPWMFSVLKILARCKRLRGTPFDLFGWSPERRLERELIVQYEQMVRQFITEYDRIDYQTAVQLARLPEDIRGFGHVKMRSIERFREQRQNLLAALHDESARHSEVA